MSNLELLQGIVERVYYKHKDNHEGKVADYIPVFAEVDPDAFGITLCTVDNEVISVGETQAEFSLQSISKAFAYGLAIEEHGVEHVDEYIGIEPSGDSFNAIEVDAQHCAFNPMVNIGALTATGLIYDKHGLDANRRILDFFSQLAGTDLSYDEAVYESEMSTSYRNRASGYYLRSVDKLQAPVEERLSAYIRQCSINVTTESLARMAATLANFGVSPQTGETLYSPSTVRRILSVMFTCGMYNFAGRWAVDIGLPAMAGVSGGVMAVVNRQIGIAIHSPRLDSYGKSVRATAACIHLAEELGLHSFEFTNSGSSMLGIYMQE